jgi:hypothetical protein
MTTRQQKLQQMDRERRLVVLARYLSEQKPLTMYAEEMGISYKTAKRDHQIMKEKLEIEAKDAIVDYKENQLVRISKKWDEIESSQTMSDAEKHQAWARWMKLEMDLRGTAAPQKHLVGMAIPIRLGEELRAVVSQLDEDQVQQLVLHAQGILNGEIEGGEPKAIPITFIKPAGHELGFSPQVIEKPDPLENRPGRRRLPQPQQLPPVIDADTEEIDADAWLQEKLNEQI